MMVNPVDDLRAPKGIGLGLVLSGLLWLGIIAAIVAIIAKWGVPSIT